MKLIVHGPNLHNQTQGTFHVHAAPCRDNAKEVRENGSVDPIVLDASSVIDVVDAIYPADQFEDRDAHIDAYIADFHFAPCVKDLPTHTDPKGSPVMATTTKTNGNGNGGNGKKGNGNGGNGEAKPAAAKPTAPAKATTARKRNGGNGEPATPAQPAPAASAAFTWPGGAQATLVRYLKARVSDTFDPENPARPYINTSGRLFVHSSDWREWLVDNGLAPSKSEAAKPLRDLGMSVKATPLPGLGRALGFYIGDTLPKGTEKLPRREGRSSSGPRAPRNPLRGLSDAQREVVAAALTAYKPTRANKAHGDVRDELLALLP
jgi:hypothetical protein